MQSSWLWTERAKPFVGKSSSGTFTPFTMRVLDGSVWQSRQSELVNFSGALVLVAAPAVKAAKRNPASRASRGSFRLSIRWPDSIRI